MATEVFLPQTEDNMSHLVAFVMGIIVATVGFTGIARVADNGVQKVQEISREAAK